MRTEIKIANEEGDGRNYRGGARQREPGAATVEPAQHAGAANPSSRDQRWPFAQPTTALIEVLRTLAGLGADAAGARGLAGDVKVVDARGEVAVSFTGLQCQPGDVVPGIAGL